jgi:hypothetical protein
MACAIKRDYSEKIDLVQEILVLILIVKNFPNSRLELKLVFSHVPKNFYKSSVTSFLTCASCKLGQ